VKTGRNDTKQERLAARRRVDAYWNRRVDLEREVQALREAVKAQNVLYNNLITRLVELEREVKRRR